MLVDTAKPQNSQGFNPNVNSESLMVEASKGQKVMWWIAFFVSWLTIIGGIVMVIMWNNWANFYRSYQFEIEQASSNIQVNETKRAETLVKLLEQTKGYLKHERETYALVTELRSIDKTTADAAKADQISVEIQKEVRLAFEAYPDLKANQSISELMSASQYLEEEIAAARRLYNSKASLYNQDLYIWPRIVKASSMRLQTFRLYQASETQRKDVDMSSLSSYANPTPPPDVNSTSASNNNFSNTNLN